MWLSWALALEPVDSKLELHPVPLPVKPLKQFGDYAACDAVVNEQNTCLELPGGGFGLFPDDGSTACSAWCSEPNVCRDDGGPLASCVPRREAVLAEQGYLCEAMCDGSCGFTGERFVCLTGRVTGLTAGRIRAAPSEQGKPVGRFEAGQELKTIEREGDWVHVESGWIHHTLVGYGYVPPPPLEPGQRGLQGWVVGFSPTMREVYEVVDRGNQGAVDGPQLELCSFPLEGGKAPACIRAETDPSRFANLPAADHLAYLWNEKGLAVQERLRSAVTVPLQPVKPEVHGLKLYYDVVDGNRTLTRVERAGKELWKVDDRGGIARLEGVARLDDYLLVRIRQGPTDGCCQDYASFVVPL